jgi:hypothetical protein
VELNLRCLGSLREIGEINKLLLLIENFSKEGIYESSIERVKRAFMESCVKGYISSFDDIVESARILGVIEKDNYHILLTSLGVRLLKINRKKHYEFSDKQCNVLINYLLFARSLLWEQINLLVREFSYNPITQNYERQQNTFSEFHCNLNVLFLASIIGLYDGLIINPKYTELLRKKIRYMRNSQWWDKEPTEEELAASKEAEILVKKAEIERLTLIGRSDLASNVDLVSDFDSTLGYDISSYEGNNSKIDAHDKFIEVKESSKARVMFCFTNNEMSTARKLKNKYDIYFIGNHSVGKKFSQCIVEIINNPANALFVTSKFEINAKKFIIKQL